MAVTVQEVKAFIKDADRSREVWLRNANKSWDELKKQQKNHRLWSVTPNSLRHRARYPAWYSIFKIRQPLLLSRVGIPIGKDTSEAATDSVAATAALCLERLAKNLARSFDFLDVMCDCRDDYLATNFTTACAYYECEEVKQRVKEYLTPTQIPGSKEMVFVDASGKVVKENNLEVMQDDEGFYIEHDETIDIENERICLEPVLYSEIYVDPGIRRWSRCRRVAFERWYSVPEFKRVFGLEAYQKIPSQERQLYESPDTDEAQPKRQSIRVYNYWDEYEKEPYWIAENGSEFIYPSGYLPEEEEDEYGDDDETENGIYDLDGFFPLVEPLVTNKPTDSFWPVCEYFQLFEIFEDIHTIFSRMVSITKALRARLLFDNNIEGLQEALNEAAENDAFGVPNLSQALSGAGGSITNAVQYIPVTELITGLAQLYTALEQRLQTVQQLSGTGDLVQGMSNDNTGKTLGERQMEEKYAINQIAEPQRKMAEFVRSAYQLITEMAIKNFKPESLDIYIIPQTLPPEHQKNYEAAVGMLRETSKRFRVELETDSTIAINENYDKQMRTELVNALTSSLEKTASIAEQSPALLQIELHALKFLIQGFRQAKMFQNEITEAIDNVIKQAEEAKKGPPPFNKDEADAQNEAARDQAEVQTDRMRIQADAQTKYAELQSTERIEYAKLQQAAMVAQMQSRIDSFKAQAEASNDAQQTSIAYQRLTADINEASEQLDIDRNNLFVNMRKVTSGQELAQFELMVNRQIETSKLSLAQQALELEEWHALLSAHEKGRVDARLENEQNLETAALQIQGAKVAKEVATPPESPVHYNVNIDQRPQSSSESLSVNRDKFGTVRSFKQQKKVQTDEPNGA